MSTSPEITGSITVDYCNPEWFAALPQPESLRERIARVLWDHGERESQKWLPGGPLVAWEEVPADDSYRRSTLAQADAVIAALPLQQLLITLGDQRTVAWIITQGELA